jgi:3-oxoacid CoA-transferase subunit A
MIASYVGENAEFERQYLGGELEVELTPQGTLAERMHAGGSGIPAFYTKTGAGTVIETGEWPIKFKPGTIEAAVPGIARERRDFNGETYIMEHAIKNQYGIVKAWKGDTMGNLIYRTAAQNFNPLIAMSSDVTIAEVEELVEPGELDPDQIHTPGVHVNRIIQGASY